MAGCQTACQRHSSSWPPRSSEDCFLKSSIKTSLTPEFLVGKVTIVHPVVPSSLLRQYYTSTDKLFVVSTPSYCPHGAPVFLSYCPQGFSDFLSSNPSFSHNRIYTRLSECRCLRGAFMSANNLSLIVGLKESNFELCDSFVVCTDPLKSSLSTVFLNGFPIEIQFRRDICQ